MSAMQCSGSCDPSYSVNITVKMVYHITPNNGRHALLSDGITCVIILTMHDFMLEFDWLVA